MKTNLTRLFGSGVLVLLVGASCSDDKESVSSGAPTTASAPSVSSTTGTTPTTNATVPGASSIDVAALAESWGCGYGFRVSNEEQTEAVVIEWTDADFTTEGTPLPDAPVTLPDPGWKAEVQLGSDLFANWCNDVIEPDTPTPEFDETWTITEGTLTFGGVGGTCGTSDVTASLSGAVATDEEGNEVPIDDVELQNISWGCFAG